MGVERFDRGSTDHGVDDVAVLKDRVGTGNAALAQSGDGADPSVARQVQVRQLVARPTRGDEPFDQQHVGAGVDPLGRRTVGHDPLENPLGRPFDRGDGGDTKSFEDLGPTGVIDAGHHPLHPERLPGHPGHQDVGVVAVGNRGEGRRLFDARLLQAVPVESDTGDGAPREVLGEPFERPGTAVDDGHAVTALLEVAGQAGPHSSATHYDYVHRVTT